jgi:hypothetical protein
MEEQWFFLYNFHMSPQETKKIPIFDRKWFIDRFVAQKAKEQEAYEREVKKKH